MLKTMDSLETKINQFQVAWQNFYASTGIEALMKWLVDLGTSILNWANNLPKAFGKIPGQLLAMIVNFVSIVKPLLIKLIADIANQIEQARKKQARDGIQSAREQGEQEARAYQEGQQKIKSSKREKWGTGLNYASAGIYAVGGVIANKFGSTTRGQIGASVSNIIGGGAQGVAGFLSGNPLAMISGILSTLSGIISLGDASLNAATKAAEEASQRYEEAHNEEVQKRSEYKDLKSNLDRLEELRSKRFESDEAMQSYQEAVNTIADSAPLLISGFDEAGNVILDVTKKEEALTAARKAAADASYAAAEAQLAQNQTDIDLVKEKIDKIMPEKFSISNPSGEEEIGAYRLEYGNESISLKDLGVTSIDQAMSLKRGFYEGEGYEYINAVQWLIEKGKITGDAVSEIYDLLTQLNSLTQLTPSLTQGSISAKIGARAALFERDFAEESTGLKSIIDQQMYNLYQEGGFSYTSVDDFFTKNRQVFVDATAVYQEFWDNLTEGQQEELDNMLSSPETYSFQTIIDKFGIDTNDEIYNYLEDVYTNNSQEIADALEKDLKLKGTKTQFSRIIDEDTLTYTQASLIRTASDTVLNYQDKGLEALSQGYSLFFKLLWDDIKTLPSEQQDLFFSLMKDADLSSVTGINDFIKQIQEMDFLTDDQKTMFIAAVGDLANYVITNLTTEFGSLQSDVAKTQKQISDNTKNWAKSMDLSSAMEAYNKLAATGILGEESFSDVFQKDITDPTKYIFTARGQELADYFDYETSTLRKSNEELATTLYDSKDYLGKLDKTDVEKDIFSLGFGIEGLGTPEERLQAYRESAEKDEAFLEQIETLGLTSSFSEVLAGEKEWFDFWNEYHHALDRLTGDLESTNALLDSGIIEISGFVGFGDFNSAIQRASQGIESLNEYFSDEVFDLFQLSEMISTLESKGNLSQQEQDTLTWLKYIRTQAQSSYTTFLQDLVSGGWELVEKNFGSYTLQETDVSQLKESAGGGIAETTRKYVNLLGFSFEDANNLIVQAIEQETKATSGSAQEALRNVSMYGGGAVASLDTIQQLANAIGVPIEMLLGEYVEELGMFQLTPRTPEIQAQLDNITNYTDILEESLISNLEQISSYFSSAIGGTLSAGDRSSFNAGLKMMGIDMEIDFTRTEEGFKMSRQQAFDLYKEIKKIDSVTAQIMLGDLVENLGDAEDKYANIYEVNRKIAELETDITSATGNRKAYLESELGLYQDISRELAKQEDAYNFMKGETPSWANGPLSAWEGIGEAFSVLKGSDFKRGYIAIDDFRNMVLMMGDEILQDATIWGEKTTTASELLLAGSSALTNVSGKNMIDLSKLGTQFNLGAEQMGEGLMKGIHTLAKNQIDMLDAEIAFLETYAKTEEVFKNLETNGDNKIDLGELALGLFNEDGSLNNTGDVYKLFKQRGNELISGLSNLGIETVDQALDALINGINGKALTDEQENQVLQALAEALTGWYDETKDRDWEVIGGQLFVDGIQLPLGSISFAAPDNNENPFADYISTYGKDYEEEFNTTFSKFTESLKAENKETYTIGDFLNFAKESGASDEFIKWLTENLGEILASAEGAKKQFVDELGKPVDATMDITLGLYVADGKYYFADGTPITSQQQMVDYVNSQLENQGSESKITVNTQVVGNITRTTYQINGAGTEFDSAEEAYRSLGGVSATVAMDTYSTSADINVIPASITIQANGENGELTAEPLESVNAEANQIIVSPAEGATVSIGDANNNFSVDSVEMKANSLTITPESVNVAGTDGTSTVVIQNELTGQVATMTISADNSTVDSGSINVQSYNVSITDGNGNEASIEVSGTAKLQAVIDNLTSDEEGNYTITSINGTAIIDTDQSLADTELNTFFNSWNGQEIVFNIKTEYSPGAGAGLDIPNKAGTTPRQQLANILEQDIGSSATVLNTYKDTFLDAYNAIRTATEAGIPISESDITFLHDFAQALYSSGIEGENGYPLSEEVESLTKSAEELSGVSSSVINTATILSNLDLASTATYLSQMATDGATLITLDFSNFAGLETVASTVQSAIAEIAQDLAAMNGQTITVNVVENKNGVSDDTTTTTTNNQVYSLDTTGVQTGLDDLSTSVKNIGNAAKNQQQALDTLTQKLKKISDAISRIPSYGANRISNLASSISKIPSSKKITTTIMVQVVMRSNTTQLTPSQGNKAIYTTTFGSSAKGNVALAKGTLMGELGPELVVSNGRYFIAGENGAEFVNLADDAIVFNHLQTEELLKKGNAGRGFAINGEDKATAFAKGGIAKASASDALKQLKEIRAMWQALLDASASDLGKKAGSGGGGGGGGGKGQDPKAITHDLERWYNLLRQIAKYEQQITLEQAKRKNMQSGYSYVDSLEKELSLLRKQEKAYRQLSAIQRDWYDIRRQELLNTDFAKIFTYDSEGLMQYVDGMDRGLDILAKLNSTDATGAPTGVGANSQSQIDYLKSIGFDVEKYLRTNDDGTKAETTDDLMNNFWNRVDGWMEELDSLYDEYNEHLSDIEDTVEAQQEILQEYIDNQLSIEEKLLTAVEDRTQAEIDKLQDLLDATQDASEKYIDGLSKALSKEQELYNQNQNNQELNKLQRQLAILQRSGGSTSEIKSLQDQIDSRLQSDYFDAMQKQIDAIQEASDNQIEKLQNQIDIMTESLEYQKENGLLWKEVYEMMNQWTPDQMLAFIEQYTKAYREDSGTQNKENSKETKKELEIWDAKRRLAEREDAWNKYYPNANYDQQLKEANKAEAQEAFNTAFANGGAKAGEDAANAIFERAKKAMEDVSKPGDNIPSQPSAPSEEPAGMSRGTVHTKNGVNLYMRKNPDLKATVVGKIPNGKEVEIFDDFSNDKWYKVRYGGVTGYSWKGNITKFKNGGLIDFTGPAWVDGSKNKPEYILNAKDTDLLRNKLFGNSNSSLLKLIDSIKELADSCSVSGKFGETSTPISIESVNVNIGMDTISNDYDARRAGQEVIKEILDISRKSGNLTLSRR